MFMGKPAFEQAVGSWCSITAMNGFAVVICGIKFRLCISMEEHFLWLPGLCSAWPVQLQQLTLRNSLIP